MKKIISLYQRNYDGDRKVRDEVVPGAEWVLRGEGVATRKYDGTCCLVRNGMLYKRHELKPGKEPPENFEAATVPDPVTGKIQGWVPVGDGPEDFYHRSAWARYEQGLRGPYEDGTYELCGPKVNGNHEGLADHLLIPHNQTAFAHGGPVRDYESIRIWLLTHDYEGIVWHHPDGRMVKIKRKDF